MEGAIFEQNTFYNICLSIKMQHKTAWNIRQFQKYFFYEPVYCALLRAHVLTTLNKEIRRFEDYLSLSRSWPSLKTETKVLYLFSLSNIHNMFRHSALIKWYLIDDWQKHNRSQNKKTPLSLSPAISQKTWGPSPRGVVTKKIKRLKCAVKLSREEYIMFLKFA